MAALNWFALWLLCFLAAGSRLTSAKKAQTAFGDRELLSTFPSNPGFPEGVAVFKDKVSRLLRVYSLAQSTFT